MAVSGSTKLGRPREFDPDVALDRAVLVFWEHGFDGASLTDLTSAMGISRTSMYAAFGNKEQLYVKALERYVNGLGAYMALALHEPTGREFAATFLHGAVRVGTHPGRPAGCPSIQGSIATGPAGRSARASAVSLRDQACDIMAERLRRAQDEGDLSPDADPVVLSRFLMTMANGIAVQAGDGVSREQLHRVADAALLGWPSA